MCVFCGCHVLLVVFHEVFSSSLSSLTFPDCLSESGEGHIKGIKCDRVKWKSSAGDDAVGRKQL